MNPSRVLFQIEFMIVNQFQRLKRNRSQGNDYPRIDQFNCAPQKTRTVSDFTCRGPAISARRRTRVAQRRAGNKDIFARQTD